jgi:hypothetical protein
MKVEARIRRPLTVVIAMLLVSGLAVLIGTHSTPSSALGLQATPQAAANVPRSREEVVAQGLAIFDVNPAIWRVVEIQPVTFNDATAISGDVSFTLQMNGVTIVRNEVTQKRARLEPGEAYFMSADDEYLRYSLQGTPSTLWSIQYVAPDAPDDEAGGKIIYKSDPITQFPGGTRDLELVRNILLPGDAAPLTSHKEPVLLLATAGEIEVSAGADATVTLSPGNGLVLPGTATIRNKGAADASYAVVTTGARVPDPGDELSGSSGEATSGTPAAEATPEATVAATSTPAEPDADGDGLSDAKEAELGTDPNKADTDGDGASDGTEVIISGTDPLDPNSKP